jgi:hypothetical protein
MTMGKRSTVYSPKGEDGDGAATVSGAFIEGEMVQSGQ